jgi:hypothetical protein
MNMVFSAKRSNKIVPVTPPKNYLTPVPDTSNSIATVTTDRSVNVVVKGAGPYVIQRFGMFNLAPTSDCSSCGGKK